METGIKSSFIPQGPIVPARAEARRGDGMGFLLVLAIVILVASSTLAVGVFLYSQFLSKSAASKLEQLQRAKEAFEPSLIQDLTRLDDRMRAADIILGGHVAPSSLFHLLEQLTLKTVSFASFSFVSNNDGVKIVMTGIAASVNSIALQADLLSKSGAITNPIFSNIARQQNGVHFDFAANVERASMRYQTEAEAQPKENVSAQPQAPASPFGTPDATSNQAPSHASSTTP